MLSKIQINDYTNIKRKIEEKQTLFSEENQYLKKKCLKFSCK